MSIVELFGNTGVDPTLLAALVVVAGGLLGYSHQKRLERNAKLREKRQAAYEAYLHSLHADEVTRQRYSGTHPHLPASAVPANIGDILFESRNIHQRAKLTVFIIGSDAVVEAAGAYQKITNDNRTMGSQRQDAFATLVAAMRRDSFEKTRLTSRQIAELAPMGHVDGSNVISSQGKRS